MELSLSPEELQALRDRARQKTSALRSAGQPRQVGPFDPRQAEPFSAAQGEALEALLRLFAQLLGTLWQERLQAPCEVTLAALEPLSAKLFLESGSGPAYQARLGPPESSLTLAIEAALALALLERLLGGTGKEAPAARALTVLEQQVLQPLAELAGQALRQVSPGLLAPEPPLIISGEPALQELRTSTDRLLGLRFAVRFQELPGELRLALPSTLWTTLLRHLTPAEQPPKMRPPQSRDHLRQKLLQSRFAAEVLLPPSRVTLRQLSALVPGDVLSLEVRASEPLEVQVSGRKMLLAAAVACGLRRGAQVQAVLSIIPPQEPGETP